MTKIGIDFGTTNSCLVAYDKKSGKFEHFHEEGGVPKPFPSVVWYHDNNITVGKKAKESINRLATDSGHCHVSSIKSKLGTGQEISILGTLRPPFVVAAEIIRYLKSNAIRKIAENAGVELHQAVFTVPVNFSGKKRMDLRRAAREAGIEVLTFIHEPFAAIIGYFFNNRAEVPIINYDGKCFLVFDWGGGTLDITVAKSEGTRLFELSTSEMTGKAGDAFDGYLFHYCCARFIEKNRDKYDEEIIIAALERKRDILLAAAEKCKIELSTSETTIFDGGEVNFSLRDGTFEYEEFVETVTREEFEKLIMSDIEAAIGKIDTAIRAAGINPEQISLVLPIGGSAQIPLVEKTLRDRFGYKVKTIANPDTVIAEGAAVVAEMNWRPFLSKNIMVELSDGSFWTTFERNTLLTGALPPKKETFTCVDFRDSEAKIILVEGVSSTSAKKVLGVLNVPTAKRGDLPPGVLCDDIEIYFEIDNDFVLTAKGHSKYRGHRTTLEIHEICFGIDMR